MLGHEETLGLIKIAQNGDENALSTMVTSNMPLIKSVVKRYNSKYIEYDDLLQLGAIGLIKAIKNFDTSYGVRFSTYAVPMIAGEIKRFIRDDGAIKVSRSIKMQAYKINMFIEHFKQTNQAEPTLKDIANEFNIPINEISFILDSSKLPISIYTESSDDSSIRLIDKIAVQDTSEDIIDRLLIKEIINSLPAREKKIIIYRYFRDKTQSEIAKEIGISQVQISRLENKILEKIRTSFSS